MKKEELVKQAVSNGITKYLDECRDNIIPFTEETFSIANSWKINKVAFGKDLLRAPANALWMPFYFAGSLLNKGFIKAHPGKEPIFNISAGFTTDVEREVEWIIYTNFLKIPFKQKNREYAGNRLLEIIMEEDALSSIIDDSMLEIAKLTLSKGAENDLADKMLEYVDSRKAAAELSATLIGAATSYVTTKSMNLGILSMGQTLASSSAYNSAISNFALGRTLGGTFYSIVPVSTSTGALVLSTGGVAAALGVLSAFGGVIADPIQRKLGWHQKKLHKLIDSLENQLLFNKNESLGIKDDYVARVLDIIDFIYTVVKK